MDPTASLRRKRTCVGEPPANSGVVELPLILTLRHGIIDPFPFHPSEV